MMIIVFSIIIVISLIIIFLFALAVYNHLIRLKNRYKNAFSQIDVQLKRRHDLIPNLVETSKKYMEHERETLESVIAARNQASGAAKKAKQNIGQENLLKNLAGAEGALDAGLGRLFAVMENYPELKAIESLTELTDELRSTENKIAFSRQAYNDAVMHYNISREVFPNTIIANMFSFPPIAQLKTAEKERINPQVKF